MPLTPGTGQHRMEQIMSAKPRKKTRRTGASRIRKAGKSEPRNSGGHVPAPRISNLLESGIEVHKQGDISAAEEFYRQALEIDPDSAPALHLQGVVFHQRGDNASAIRLIGKSLEINPDFADAHVNMGAAQFADGNKKIAEGHFRRAIALNPGKGDGYSNLAAVLSDLGEVDEAIEAYHEAIRRNHWKPIYARRLADLYMDRGEWAKAFEQYEKFLGEVPGDADAIYQSGYALDRLARFEEAEPRLRRAHELEPESLIGMFDLGTLLERLGRTEEAQPYLDRILNAGPEEEKALFDLANNYMSRSDSNRALRVYERLILLDPDDPHSRTNYGVALGREGRMDESIAEFERVIEKSPDFVEAHNNLGAAYLHVGDPKRQIAALKEVLRLDPRHAPAHNNLCLAQLYAGRFDEAYLNAHGAMLLEGFKPGHYANPLKVFFAMCCFDDLDGIGDVLDLVEKHSGLEASLMFLDLLSRAGTAERIERLFRLHDEWGRKHSEPALIDPLPPFAARSKKAKIRVAFVSSDLRGHSVAKFVYPVLRNFDREKYEIYCYTPYLAENDDMQQEIIRQVTEFREVGNRSMREAAEMIRGDEIDILFELNGFTKDSRLGALPYKPAPVQIYWLGYPYTTGLRQVDYMLLDPYFRPENDDWLAEEPLLLPESWVCYMPKNNLPYDETPAFERKGYVTFGTLNNPYKFTRETVAAWAAIMRGTQDSHFLFVRDTCESPVFCTNIAKEFAKHGIAGDRLDFVSNRALGISHMDFYPEMDLSLDSFPLTGGTTTSEALWMGVPVISLVGPCTHQRMGYSMLNNIGAGELCAFSVEEYIEKGIALANDPDSIREYRKGLRSAMAASPLCDVDRFVRNFETMLEEVIERHGLR